MHCSSPFRCSYARVAVTVGTGSFITSVGSWWNPNFTEECLGCQWMVEGNDDGEKRTCQGNRGGVVHFIGGFMVYSFKVDTFHV